MAGPPQPSSTARSSPSGSSRRASATTRASTSAWLPNARGTAPRSSSSTTPRRGVLQTARRQSAWGASSTAAALVACRLTGLAPEAYELGDRELTAFISHPDGMAVVVAVLADIVGMLSLTEARNGVPVGVLVSVTTIPAASNVGVATAYREWSEVRGCGPATWPQRGCAGRGRRRDPRDPGPCYDADRTRACRRTACVALSRTVHHLRRPAPPEKSLAII
jgi:hypothetical protein